MLYRSYFVWHVTLLYWNLTVVLQALWQDAEKRSTANGVILSRKRFLNSVGQLCVLQYNGLGVDSIYFHRIREGSLYNVQDRLRCEDGDADTSSG